MLRLPIGSAVILSELVCVCDNEFWVSAQPRQTMFCPFCGEKKAEANGEVKVYIKKPEPEIDYEK